MATVPTTTYTTIRDVYEFMNLYQEVWGEAVGTGDSQETEFSLDNRKVVTGSLTVYLAGVVTTAYTLDADAGVITFDSAPSAVAITADYWYSDIPSSVVGTYITRVEKAIDSRMGRSFGTATNVTEFYDGRGDDSSNPFYYQGVQFDVDAQAQIRPLNEKFYQDSVLQVQYYPILGVRLLAVNNSIDQQYDQSYYDADATFGGATWIAQTFTAGASSNLVAVDIPIKYNTGTVGAITAALYATSGNVPTGSALATADTVSLTSSDTNYYYQRFTFAVNPYKMTQGTVYAIVLSAASASSTSTFKVMQDGTTSAFSGGQYAASTNSGSTWTGTSTKDLIFATWVATTLPYGQWTTVNNEGKVILMPQNLITSASTSGSSGVYAGPTFAKGIQNIVINYAYGYTSVPLIIEDLATKMAAVNLMRSRIMGSPVPQNLNANNIKSIEQEIEYVFTTFGRKLEGAII